MKVYAITKVESGAAGHGMPGREYLCLHCDGEYTPEHVSPLFLNEDKARDYINSLESWSRSSYVVTTLDLID